MIVSSACVKQRQLKIEWMPTILTRALSWALSGFGNTFTLEKRLRFQTIGIASNLCNSGQVYSIRCLNNDAKLNFASNL